MIVLSSLQDRQVAELLKGGQIGVIPTDTIYGLAALATDRAATARLYALKNRENKPGTIIAASIQQLIDLGVDETVLRAVAHLWPNPLSIVIDAHDDLDYLHQEVGSLAVRIPKNDELRRLLEQTGPLVTSSANHPGQPPATSLADAQAYFDDQIDFYVDGGSLSNRPPSTVVRYRPGGSLELLRQGAVVLNGKGEIA